MRILKRVLAFCLGCCAVAGTLEAGLQLTARFNLFNQLDEPGLLRLTDEELNDPNLIRIVALGESTTATFSRHKKYPDHYETSTKDMTWPAVLERKLNQADEIKKAHKRVVVINMGKASSNSAFIMEQFERAYPRIKPHFVISMLGINDVVAMLTTKKPFWNHFYLYRLARQAVRDYSCQDCYNVSYKDDMIPATGNIIGLNSKVSQRYFDVTTKAPYPKSVGDFEKTIASYERLLSQHPEAEDELAAAELLRLFHIITTSPYLQNQSQDVNEINDLAKQRAVEFIKKYADYLAHYGELIKLTCFIGVRTNNNKSCLEIATKGLKMGVPLTTDLLATVGNLDTDRVSAYSKAIRDSGYVILDSSDPITMTYQSYARLKNLCKKNSIHWFAMQYPTGSTAGIKSMIWPQPELDEAAKNLNPQLLFHSYFYLSEQPGLFPNDSTISFISNENFAHIASGKNEPLYYKDLFARSHGPKFGHTTPLGHELIADNAYKVVEPYLMKWINKDLKK